PSRRALHAFPTRRSSDLGAGAVGGVGAGGAAIGSCAGGRPDGFAGRADGRLAAVVGRVVGAGRRVRRRSTGARWGAATWAAGAADRKSTRLNSSHDQDSY